MNQTPARFPLANGLILCSGVNYNKYSIFFPVVGLELIQGDILRFAPSLLRFSFFLRRILNLHYFFSPSSLNSELVSFQKENNKNSQQYFYLIVLNSTSTSSVGRVNCADTHCCSSRRTDIIPDFLC